MPLVVLLKVGQGTNNDTIRLGTVGKVARWLRGKNREHQIDE